MEFLEGSPKKEKIDKIMWVSIIKMRDLHGLEIKPWQLSFPHIQIMITQNKNIYDAV
jgi:hypothetical protein